MSNWGNSNCFELFVPKVKGLENWFYYCSLVILLTMDTVGGHRSHRLRIAVLLGYNTCHCRLLDVVMFSYSIVKRDECNCRENHFFLVLLLLIAVQGMHADVHLHHIWGEVQGTCRSQTPQIWFSYMFPPFKEMKNQ